MNKMIARRRQSGISLVELMVGTVIALLGTLIIFQVFATNEDIKRTTTSAGDAQQSGSFSSYILERHIRLAGAGLAHAEGVWGCPLQVWKNTTNAVVPPTSLSGGNYPAPFNVITTALGTSVLRLAPVLIVRGSDTDTIVVMAGQHETMAVPLKSTSPPDTTSVALVNTVGVNQSAVSPADPKDFLLAVDQDPTRGVADCRIVQANDTLPGPPTTALPRRTVPNPLVLAGAPYTPTDALNGYSATIHLANLGSSPAFLAFGVGSDGQTANALLSYDLIQSASPVGLADNLISIRALYGISAGATSSAITSWVAPTGAWAASTLMDGTVGSNANIASIRGIRLAIVARSAQYEKEDVTAANWALFGDLPAESQVDALPGSVTATSTWQNYRYKTYDVTIPLRSMLLMNNS